MDVLARTPRRFLIAVLWLPGFIVSGALLLLIAATVAGLLTTALLATLTTQFDRRQVTINPRRSPEDDDEPLPIGG